ncbi:MAG: hypothetical protein JSR47_19910 [Proteobacteria bacterium]|nr:hypothetical protein [Pseudomonadota bacterium]
MIRLKVGNVQPRSRIALKAIAIAIAFGPSSPSWAIEPTVDAYRHEVADAVAHVTTPLVGRGASAAERAPLELTVSLVFARRGSQPRDPRCFLSLRRMFGEQIQALSAVTGQAIREVDGDAPRTVTLVVGHVTGAGSDLSDISLDMWRASARSQATFAIHENGAGIGTPHEVHLNVLSGLYGAMSGKLVYGQALVNWGSTYFEAFPNSQDGHCQLNFAEQIAFLSTLDVRERLRDELEDVHIAWRNRAQEASGDWARSPLIGRDLNYLIIASIFCLQTRLPTTTTILGDCSSRMANLMLARSHQ